MNSCLGNTDQGEVNPDMYVNHKAYQWDEAMKVANGEVVLKSEFIYPDYTLVMEFDKIDKGKVDFSKYDSRCK